MKSGPRVNLSAAPRPATDTGWVGLLLVGVLLATAPVQAGMANPFVPKADLWPHWQASDETNPRTIDHGDWQTVLDAYLDAGHPSGIDRFDYGAVTGADRARLRAYIERLAGLDPRGYSRAEQLAYWINLYNALTVDLVLAHYPVTTIRRIHGGVLRLGPWNRDIIEITGQMLTLNDIEHRILRPIYRDPRLHYAVNCASLGCPNLAREAFTAANTERLLEAAARAYVNHPRGVDFDDKDRLHISSIFDWYQVDFGDNRESLLEHLATYARPSLAARLRAYDGQIQYRYDWALNDP